MKQIKRSLYLIDSINIRFGWFVAFLMVPMIGIVVGEVIMRYFFNHPTVWAYELSLFTFGSFFVLAGAYTLAVRGHVSVDILYSHLPLRGRAILDVVTCTLFFLFIGLLLKESGIATLTSWQIAERTNSDWHPIYYPVRTTLPIACVLLLLQGLAKLIRDLHIAITGKELT
jgi:TRAP-type mannitol/chloroaromatic compound transport system permease small subunit